MSRFSTLLHHAFELATAVGWMCVGFALLIEPNTALLSPVGRYVGDWQYVWSIMYVLAAPAIVFGITERQFRYRAAGLCLLAGGLLMQGVAAVTFNIEPRVLVYFMYAAACVSRVFYLILVCPKELRR